MPVKVCTNAITFDANELKDIGKNVDLVKYLTNI